MKTITFFLVVILAISLPADDDIPLNGARYIYKTWHCQIKGDGFELKVKNKIEVYNTLGEDYAQVVALENLYSKVKNVNIKLYDSSGKEIYDLSKKDLNKSCGYSSGTVYDDLCYYYSEVKAPQFPYTIEYEYTTEYKSLFFWHFARFQHYIPVDSAEYTLAAPNNFKFESKIYGLDISADSDFEGDKIIYTWSKNDIPAFESIDYLPPGAREIGGVDFAAHKIKLSDYRLEELSWDGIGDWYNKLAYGNYQNVNNIFVENKQEKIKQVYDRIISEIRYVAIEIGIGGWKPYEPELTKSRKFGDCKDMTTLLISELAAVGIDANPVLVLTRDNGPVDVDFPNIGFNHVIAMTVLDNDTIWMDPTCSKCPFGEIPRSDEDIDVMVVNHGGGEIVRTPKSHPDMNGESRITDMVLSRENYVSIKTEMTAYGNHEQRLRYLLENLDKDDEKSMIERIFSGADKIYKIYKFEISNLDDIYQPLKISFSGRTIKPVDVIGSKIYFNPHIFNSLNQLEKINLDYRDYPIEIIYPHFERDSINFTWAPEFNVDSIVMPDNETTEFEFGHIIRSSSNTDKTITMIIEKQYNDYIIDTTQFDDFDHFQSKIKKISSDHLKLIKSN